MKNKFIRMVSSSVSKVANFCKSSSSVRMSSAKRAFVPFILLSTLMMLFYILCLSLGGIWFFIDVLSKVAGFMGVKALSLLFSKMGCSSTLAFVIGCAVRTLVTTEATLRIENMMLPADRTSEASSSDSEEASSSDSELTLEQRVLNEKEGIRTTLIDGISRYLDLFEKEIIQEYPEATVEIGTLTFYENMRKSLVSDYGFDNPSPSSLTTLKKCHAAIKGELSFLDEKPPYWKNNIIYDNLRGVLLKGKRDH